MISSGASWSGAAVPGDRLQAILGYIDRLKQGDLDAELGGPGAGGDLGAVEAALRELGDALRDRDELVRVAQEVAAANLRRLDDLAQELSRTREINQEQQETIRTLSTPIIQVWEGVLMMPVLGAVDLRRAEQMMQALLGAVARAQCRAVIIDLTGVESIDAALGGLLLSLVRAVELLGARGIIVGIRPEVARGLLADGVDISRVATLSRLRDALVLCMGQAPARPALRNSLR
ncbi:STAS domain-containing protein [Sorangium sp. So ce1151]|uniref:STAS domain-containing protein n=1 Tax=Sorangium sp. So ce1151 TaxID=3133332 RepID=UPI003F5E3838